MSEDVKIPKLEGISFNKEECIRNNFLDETDDIELYSNLYPIKFTKDIEICEYPFKILPEVHEESIILKIFREASQKLFKIYGYYYLSGNSFFAVKKIEKDNEFKVEIKKNGKLEYSIFVYRNAHSSIINDKKKMFSEIEERVLYLVIREILSANPYVHFDRDNLYLENKWKRVKSNNKENIYYNIHDGYKLSLQQGNCGLCLVIGVKNKIKGEFTVYDFLNKKNSLIGRKFIPNEGSRHQIICGFSKDKTPSNTYRNYNNESITFFEYYKRHFGIEIQDLNQPLIEVENRDPQYKEKI